MIPPSDVLEAARLLGFRQLVPAYANARRTEVLRGFNFASGAAGIREETGNNLLQQCCSPHTMGGLSIREKQFIEGGIAQDIGTDGRQRPDFRRISVETGVIPHLYVASCRQMV